MKAEKGKVTKYKSFANELPKGSGKDIRVWSDHYITLEDDVFYYLEAEGTRHWAYKGDTVSFEWEWKVRERDGKKFRTIQYDTFWTWDKSGKEVLRGIRERHKPRRGQEWENEIIRLQNKLRKEGIIISKDSMEEEYMLALEKAYEIEQNSENPMLGVKQHNELVFGLLLEQLHGKELS